MPHRVLVVDDEESIRTLLTAHLEDLGYEVVSAADGASGISAFDERRPHLVIVDFLLPRGNGFAVAEAVRQGDDGGQTPIIMMSGVFKNPKTAVEAREKYQVLDFLSKPLDLQQLARLVQDALASVTLDIGFGLVSSSLPQVIPTAPSTSAPASAARATHDGPQNGVSSPPDSNGAAAHPVPVPLTRSRPDLLRNGTFVGRPFPELPAEGDLSELPVALLLSCLRFDRATGMLDMTDQGTHRRIYVIRGNPTFMQSNAEGENVGALLLRRGRITEPDFDRCLRFMKTERRTLQKALLELRLVSEHDLATAYKLLAGQLLPLALGMGAGRFAWRETDAFVGRVPEGRFEPVSVLFDGIKKHVHPPQILRFFRGCQDVALVRTLQFDVLMPLFERTFTAENVAHEIDGGTSYRSLVRKYPKKAARFVPQLFALVTSGMAVLPEDADQRLAAAVGRATADIEFSLELSSDFEERDSSQDVQAREAIDRYYDEIMAQDFFQIFDVTPESDVEVIKAQYLELAGRWHEDAFEARHLGGSREKLDEIFDRIDEAYETITRDQKRADYLVYLDRKARGLPTDVDEIMRAERLFEQAEALLDGGDLDGARGALEEASERNPEPIYLATLGWVVFMLQPNAQANITDAVTLLKKAVQEQEDLAVAYQYLGQIAFRRGQTGEAVRLWKRCLDFEPDNVDAAQGLQLALERADTASGAKKRLS